MRRRRYWGWGWEDEAADPAQLGAVEGALGALLGMNDVSEAVAPDAESLSLRAPRVLPPSSLASLCAVSAQERASHAYGKSYRDVVRGLRGELTNPPDFVAYPASEAGLIALLEWCSEARVAAIPYGGGSSVCGGVEPDVGASFRGTATLDMTRMDRVLEVDHVSRAARIQAGALGPVLEDQLRPHGLTLRHFPQSFEFSTLGGWIATRSGGHFATLTTHIDDFVQSLRVVTPTGTVETRRLPGDGAGPSPDRLFMGSEGTLGVITEAWMRLQQRPTHRASFTARCDTFRSGACALRALAQSGLHPSNARLLDPREAMLNGAGGGDHAVLLVGFESADHPLDAFIARAAECVRGAGADVPPDAVKTRTGDGGARGGVEGAWRSAFLRMPYLRDALVAMGVFTETFETAITWDRFDALHERVTAAAEAACAATGGRGLVTCRVTHAYPDGAAPYFTVVAPARRGAELEQWRDVKQAITDAMLDSGGTTTHHHAVGRDFRPWWERQTPDGFSRVLAAAKATLDPNGILNPGVLLRAPSP